MFCTDQTGISRLNPAIAAWQFSPDASTISPDASRICVIMALLVSFATMISPTLKFFKSSSLWHTQRFAEIFCVPIPFPSTKI